MDGSKLGGMSPTASIKTDVNGGLWYDPIPGDMLRTYETTPQVFHVSVSKVMYKDTS